MNIELATFLRQVPLFADLPEADLVALCDSASEVQLAAGELLFAEGSSGQDAYIIHRGLIEIYKTVNGQNVHLAVCKPGEVIGELSLFEAAPRNASGVAIIDSVLIAIGHAQVDHLLRSNTNAARTMLQTVILRLQSTEASLIQSEKMAQLGSFTAGIAHEINNPSAAVLRGAQNLKAAMQRSEESAHALRLHLAAGGQPLQFERLRQQLDERSRQSPKLSAVARMDREALLEDWVTAQGIANGWQLVPNLVELGYDQAALQALVESLPPGSLVPVLVWMAAEFETTRLLEEVHTGAQRVAEIVKALKAYVYLDQAPDQEIDLHQGLEDTLVILRHKLKQGIEVVREFDRSIAPILAYGSELNQVWTNLIDNAIDAMQGRGRLTLRTRRNDRWVEVDIEDSGPGIAPEVQKKLFYPFFTTKPVGQGSGLGLNISYQIIQKHAGDILVTSQPGLTRFTVRLPAGERRQRGRG